MGQTTNVLVQTQKIIVNPSTRHVAVINAGPQGPPGPIGPTGAPGPGDPDEYVHTAGDTMTGSLTVPELWLPGGEVEARLDGIVSDLGLYLPLVGGVLSGQLSIPNATDDAHALNRITADTRYVNVDGDTMTGNLAIADPGELHFGSTVRQMINLYNTTYGIGVQSSTFYLRTASGFALYRGGVHAPDPGDSGGGERLLYVTGASMLVDAQVDVRYSSGTGVQPIILRSDSAGGPYIGLYDISGTRRGYMGNLSGTLRLHSDLGGIIFDGNNAERARIDTVGIFLVGQTNNGQFLTDAGAQVRPAGNVMATTEAASTACFWGVHLVSSAADANGQRFLTFRRGSAAEIGTITQVNTTGVAYNTTSHGPWKGNVTDLDDDAAVERVESWRPVSYQWKFDADGNLSEDGDPGGEAEHGFIAQELHKVQPSAVTPGYGTQAEQKAWQERSDAHQAAVDARASEQADWDAAPPDERAGDRPENLPPFDEPDPFMPWQGDWAKLVPDLTAAVQSLIRRNRALEARIEELERSSR